MKKIAIADDSDTERLILKGLIEESGFDLAFEASDGVEAVDRCRQSPPDLIIMDVKMPNKDGIEAAAEIGRFAPVPVVLLTGKDDDETIRRAVDAGVMAYLSKPVRREELAAAIGLAISRFGEFKELQKENADLKNTLQARKVIEKAKGLLMEKEGLVEAEAFARIRKISMDRRKSMTEVAEIIILAFEKKDVVK